MDRERERCAGTLPYHDSMIPIDVNRARMETPGCEDRVHFNNAGGSLPPRRVTEAVIGYVEREALAGGYEQAVIDSELIDRYRPRSRVTHQRDDV